VAYECRTAARRSLLRVWLLPLDPGACLYQTCIIGSSSSKLPSLRGVSWTVGPIWKRAVLVWLDKSQVPLACFRDGPKWVRLVHPFSLYYQSIYLFLSSFQLVRFVTVESAHPSSSPRLSTGVCIFLDLFQNLTALCF
jgi:hypothetical protein